MAVDPLGDVFLGAASGEAYEEPVGGGAERILPFTNLFELYGIAVDSSGNIFVSDTSDIWELPSGSSSQLKVAHLGSFGMAVDDLGNLYASDFNESSVIDLGHGKSSGSVVAPIGARFELAVNAAGDIYTTNSTNVLVTHRSQLRNFDFGSVVVGSTKTLPLEFNNLGNAALAVTPSFVSPSYKILGESPSGCLTGLAPGKSCTLSLQFSPEKEGHHRSS